MSADTRTDPPTPDPLTPLHHSPRCPSSWRCRFAVKGQPNYDGSGYRSESERAADIAAHYEIYSGTADELLAALPSAPDQRLREALTTALDEGGWKTPEPGTTSNRYRDPNAARTAHIDNLIAALSEASTSPEATLDVEAAYNTLRRAGIGERQARDITVDMLAAALTGERHDEDDDRLTPEKRSRVRALAARLRGPA